MTDLAKLADKIAAVPVHPDWTAQLHPESERSNYDSVAMVVSVRHRDAIVGALRSAAGTGQLHLEWRDGAPSKPWSQEWFVAETTFGDRVALTALPEEWTYDFKTADETHFRADKIRRWMQFPDSEFKAPDAAAAVRGAPNDTPARQRIIGDLMMPCDLQPTAEQLSAVTPAAPDHGVLQDDLRQMLQALGMNDGAQPKSPHEVFLQALAEMKRQLAGRELAHMGFAEIIEQCAQIAVAMTQKWGDPNGNDYQQGAQDHGIRIIHQIRSLIPNNAAPPVHSAADERAANILSSVNERRERMQAAMRGPAKRFSLSEPSADPVVTEEIVTAAMRAFEPYAGRILRYPEAERWHTNDVQGMREALRKAFSMAFADEGARG